MENIPRSQALFDLLDGWSACFVGRKVTSKTFVMRLRDLYQDAVRETTGSGHQGIEEIINSLAKDGIADLDSEPELDQKMLCFLEERSDYLDETGREILERVRNEVERLNSQSSPKEDTDERTENR